ncbi:MAG: SDR family NAD(P)-dependent oxidoreductase [Streptosporangiaceae bacterium]|nr:SDR family NAD(P)-dependent oxidoreductase [Streptosporangiaceae bacterium]
MTARDAASVEDLARSHPGTALPLPLDITDHAQARAVVHAAAGGLGQFNTAQERFGAIDVLVNNAGHSYRAAVEAAEDQVQELFATNFFGPAALIRAVLPGMRRHGSGTIVNVSSIGARSFPVGSGYYAASWKSPSWRSSPAPSVPASCVPSPSHAIITAVHSPSPPLMLVLGPDALISFRDAMKELSADVDAWEQTSLSTSFPLTGG